MLRILAKFRWRRSSFGATLLITWISISVCARAVIAVDAGECGGAPLLEQILAGIFADGEPGPDSNGDERASAADIVAAVALGDSPLCPTTTASIVLDIENRTGGQTVDVTLVGTRLVCDCAGGGGALTFESSFTCLGVDAQRCGEVTGLAPGEWLLELRVDAPGTGQVQYRRERLVAGVAPARSAWTAFASVLVVDDPDNTGIGSLRNRIQLANDAAKPLLIRFDDDVFPAGEVALVPLAFALPTLEADETTIDARDALGLAGNRGVDVQEMAFGGLSIGGARNHLIGLRLRNAGGQDRDLVRVAGARASGNVLEDLVVEGPATGDGIGVDDGAGSGFGAAATVIRGCEISGVGDKGVKVTTGAFARIESSHVHDNANGGIQATLGGNAYVADSLIERNAGVGAENGLAVQGAEGGIASSMSGAGNLVRDNGGNGLSVRAFATAAIADSAFVGNGTGGIRVYNDIGPAALVAVEGSAFACNVLDGAVVLDSSVVDLGGGPFASFGANAFAFNGEPEPGIDLRAVSTEEVVAVGNQWQSCGSGVSCDERAVLANDIRDGGSGVVIEPAVAVGGDGFPEVTRVVPALGRAGELVRIFGSGFDAIGGYGDGSCESIAAANGCDPVVGNCVTIGGVVAEVEAVTPTMIVARWPFTCLEPVALRVSVRRVAGVATSNSIEVCTNARGAGA